MGLFSFLFGKKKERKKNDGNVGIEKVLKYSGGTLDDCRKVSENQEIEKGQQEKVSRARASSRENDHGVGFRPLDGCEQLRFEIDVQENCASAITALGKQNPDCKLDELALRRKGYLFQNVYIYLFPPMDAVLTVDTDFSDDPDAVRVSVGGVNIGYFLGSFGAQISWLMESGMVRRVLADISGGDYLTLECDPEYDETSKRIPKDCLYIDEWSGEYRVTVFIDIEKQNTAQKPTKKQKTVFPGVNTKALPGCKQQRFQIAGGIYRMDNILSLGQINPNFMLTKSELQSKGLENVPIVKYSFPPMKTELVPEPNNQYDKNAIQVRMDGKLVGYIPKKRCSQLLDDMASGKVMRIQGAIVCSDTRTLYADSNCENGSTVQKLRIDRDDGGIIVKVFIDVQEDSQEELHNDRSVM